MRSLLSAAAVIALATPAAAQDYHFTKDIGAGGRVEIENINGKIDVSRATGRIAEVTVTKTVKRGDGNLVKAIMDDAGGGMHVCTIYLNRDRNRNSCNGGNNDSGDGNRGDRFEVDMHYVVKVPAGARLAVDNVNGTVTITGADAESKVETVNGDVIFDGVGAYSLSTVNGNVTGKFTRGAWEGTMQVETVNGSVDLTFPSDLSADIRGETVNGGISSDGFSLTVEGKWGPKSFSGRVGSGGRKLSISTVNGGITLHKK